MRNDLKKTGAYFKPSRSNQAEQKAAFATWYDKPKILVSCRTKCEITLTSVQVSLSLGFERTGCNSPLK